MRARRQRRASAPSTPQDEGVVPLEIVEENPLPDAREEEHFGVAREASPRGAPASEPSSPAVPMEWAQRHESGPAAPGRVRGACSGCGTKLTVSNRRPLRIACPVCGRTRLLT